MQLNNHKISPGLDFELENPILLYIFPHEWNMRYLFWIFGRKLYHNEKYSTIPGAKHVTAAGEKYQAYIITLLQ